MSTSAPKNSSRLWIVLLVLVTGLVHGRSILGELVYQDALVVPHANIIEVEVAETLEAAVAVISEPGKYSITVAWEVIPVLLRSISPLFGSNQAITLHVFALLVHIASVLGVLALSRKLGASNFAAGSAALLFGLHPVGVQGVAWISAMGSGLAACFALLALNCFESARARNEASVMAGSFATLAFLSNPLSLAILPIALYRWRSSSADGEQPASVRILLPLLVAFAIAWLLGAQAYESFATGFLERLEASNLNGIEVVWAQLAVFGSSLKALVWPGEQVLFRPLGIAPQLADPTTLLGLFAVIGTIAVGLLTRFRTGSIASSALFSLGLALAPLAVAAPWMLAYPVYDDHLVLALATFSCALAAILSRFPQVIGKLLVLVLAAAYATLSYQWIPTWSSNTQLLEQAAESAPRLPFAQWTCAYALVEEFGNTGDEASLERATKVIERSQDLLDEAKLPGSTVIATPEDYLRTNLVFGWSLLAGAKAEQLDDYETAKSVFRAIVDSRPENVDARIGIGIAAMGLQDVPGAELAFREALDLDPDSVAARRELGDLLIGANRWKEAQEQYERILVLQPEEYHSRLWLARSLLQQGRIERADAEARQAHELAPLFPEPMVLIGIVQLRLGNASVALDWIDRGLKGDPEDGFARLQRGHAFQALGEHRNAMVEFKRAADRMPESFEAFYSLGNSLLLMQQPEVAAEQFGRAYELQEPAEARAPLRVALFEAFSGNAPVLFGFASIDFRRADQEATQYWVDRALAADPEHAGCLHLSGILARSRGDLELALNRFKAAASLLPNSFQVQHDLGYLLLELERPEEAEPHLVRALEFIPVSPESPEASARLREKIETTVSEIRGG